MAAQAVAGPHDPARQPPGTPRRPRDQRGPARQHVLDDLAPAVKLAAVLIEDRAAAVAQAEKLVVEDRGVGPGGTVTVATGADPRDVATKYKLGFLAAADPAAGPR